MSAAGAVHVVGLMPGARWRPVPQSRVLGIDGDDVVVDVVAVGVMQMAVVEKSR